MQVFFDAVEARAEKNAKPESSLRGLIVLVIPDGLPIDPNGGWNQWRAQAVKVAINGNPRELLDCLLQSEPGRPGFPHLLAKQTNSDPTDLWLIDGDLEEDGFVLPAGRHVSGFCRFEAGSGEIP